MLLQLTDNSIRKGLVRSEDATHIGIHALQLQKISSRKSLQGGRVTETKENNTRVLIIQVGSHAEVAISTQVNSELHVIFNLIDEAHLPTTKI